MVLNQGNSLQTGHVDLATLTALEAYLYGGDRCSTWTHREVNRSNWASVGLTTLRMTSGSADYGRDASWLVTRSGDYLINAFFRARFPLLKLKADRNLRKDASIRYTKNFMHNLVKNGSLKVNETIISEFDTFVLDVRQAFWMPSQKALGYKNMIGDIPSMVSPAGWDAANADFAALGTGGFFTLPLPFFFSDDYGTSLPTASLIYIDVLIELEFAQFSELLIIHPGASDIGILDAEATAEIASISDVVQCGSGKVQPAILESDLWAEYVIVNNDERKAMAKMKRPMVIKGWQSMQEMTWDPLRSNSFNLRFSFSVQGVFTAVRNDSTAGDGSNYTTLPFGSGVDPVAYENIFYENSNRTGDLAADITSLVFPYLRPGMAVPDVTGIHYLAPFALDPLGMDPSYAPNLGKINQVILQSWPSQAAQDAGQPTNPLDHYGAELNDSEDQDHTQKFSMLCRALHQSVIVIGSGTVTLPLF